MLGLLDDPDVPVRQHAAYLVSWFPEEAASIVQTLVARLDCEFFPEILATVVVGIGLLRSAEQIEPVCALLDSPEPLLRWASATALARLRVVHGVDGCAGRAGVQRTGQRVERSSSGAEHGPQRRESVPLHGTLAAAVYRRCTRARGVGRRGIGGRGGMSAARHHPAVRHSGDSSKSPGLLLFTARLLTVVDPCGSAFASMLRVGLAPVSARQPHPLRPIARAEL